MERQTRVVDTLPLDRDPLSVRMRIEAMEKVL